MVTVSSELWQAGTTPGGQRCLHSSQDKPASRVAGLRTAAALPIPPEQGRACHELHPGQRCWWSNKGWHNDSLRTWWHFHPDYV